MALQLMFPPVHSRVVTRYVGSGIKGVGSGIKGVGSGIKGVGSGIRRVGSGITALGSGITSKRNHQFFEGPGISLYHFCGIRNICHAFGIKDQTFKYKNGISDEKKKNIRLYDHVMAPISQHPPAQFRFSCTPL